MHSQFWKIGHKYTVHKLSLSNNLGLRRYKAFHGVSPNICQILWDKLSNVRPKTSQPKHLLWCLHFLKQYNSENNNRAIFGVHEKTIRKWVWCFVKLLSDMEIVSRCLTKNIKLKKICEFFKIIAKFIDSLGKPL